MSKENIQDIPKHIAIIMDGNGRWAKSRFLKKELGHKAGAETLRKISVEAENLGVKFLTVYAFSTENWSRPQEEVDYLMKLLQDYIQQYIDDSEKNDMKITTIGDLNGLSLVLQERIKYLQEITINKTGLHVIIGINYGSRDEIIRMTKTIVDEAIKSNLQISQITEELISNHLDTKNIPDPDLLIRTSGEMRLSNFLLWQLAYTEMFFIDKYWPDFNKNDLISAINAYSKRNRRFGGR